MTPDIDLLNGEYILDTFEAGFWDLGVLGWLFGYKRRLVLTTHRLFRFDKKIIANILDVAWLPTVKTVTAGQEVLLVRFLVGLTLALSSLSILWRSIRGSDFGFAAPFALSMCNLALGALLMGMARRKIICVSSGHDKVGLRLVRMQSAESKRFIEQVFRVLGGQT